MIALGENGTVLRRSTTYMLHGGCYKYDHSTSISPREVSLVQSVFMAMNSPSSKTNPLLPWPRE